MAGGTGTIQARATAVFAALAVGAVLAVSGCGLLPVPERGATDAQAQAVLDRWSQAVAANGGEQGFVLIGDATRQVGDWEEATGANNKPAMYAGLIVADGPLPAEPGQGQIRWADGTTKAVHLLSAADALARVKAEGTAPCSECTPIHVTRATLTTASYETTRGPAAVPVWEFSLAGTAVKITRVAAVEGGVTVSPPPGPSGAGAIMIDSASASADGRSVTVSFTGAPEGDQCGADYTARAVESALAITVIVTEHPHAAFVACPAVGAVRTATATLAAPLGTRPVLDIVTGVPVPMRPAGS